MKAKKLFDDTNDSGISESSVSSEVVKAKSSGLQDVKVKQERESSVESSPQLPVAKNRKRKSPLDLDVHVSKRIKAEPVTTDYEDHETFLNKLLASDDKNNSTSTSTAFKEEKSNGKSDVERSKEKQSKKKKRRLIDEEEDFDTSLQNIINASRIKKEK